MFSYLVNRWHRRCPHCKSRKNTIVKLIEHPQRRDLVIEGRRCDKCLREYEYIALRDFSHYGIVYRHEN